MIKKESLPSLSDFGFPPHFIRPTGSVEFRWDANRQFDNLSSQMKHKITHVTDEIGTPKITRIIFLAREGFFWATTNVMGQSEKIAPLKIMARYWGIAVHTYGGHLNFQRQIFHAVKIGPTLVFDVFLKIGTRYSSHELVMKEILKGMKI